MACIESVTLQATDPAAAERFYAAVFELDAQLRPQASEHRVENLEIWSKAQPCGQRVVNKLAFAVEMLDRYAVELW
jgi:predicted enzyme related to lactoylglutathione lyase